MTKSRRRPSWRQVFPRSVVLICLLVLATHVLLVAAMAWTVDTGVPREAPVAVVTAPVVAQSIADQANSMDGRPFDAHIAKSAADARQSLTRGDIVAFLEVDLRGTRDALQLNDANGAQLNDAVRDRIEMIETTYGRTTSVRYVDTSSGQSSLVPRLTIVANAIGFIFVVIVSLLLGPVTGPLARGVLRHIALTVTAFAAATVAVWVPFLGSPQPALVTFAVLVLTVLVVGSTTLALEAVAGLAGLAMAVTLFLVQAAPLLWTNLHLLPQPWLTIAPLTPLGATDEALERALLFEGSEGILRPVLVLGAWLVVSWIISLVARRLRGRSGILLHEPAEAAQRRTNAIWRLRVGAIVIPAATALLTIAVVVPRGTLVEPALLPSQASQTEGVETGQIRSVKALNRFIARLRGSEDFEGGDVGASVLLQDGRLLFVFGDTLRNPDFDGQRFVRNSMLVFDDGRLQMVSPADRGAIIPDRPGAGARAPVGYWPMSIGREQRPGYDLVAISAQRVRASGSGEFDFENLGTSIAVFIVPRGGTPQLVDQRDIGPDDPGLDRPTWGAASAVHEGWAYLYGTSNPGSDLVFGYALSVARVRPDDILDRSKWRFWNGSEWVREAEQAVELIDAVGGTSQTLSVFEQDGTWYALSKRDEFLGTDLTVWTATSPEGPFTAGDVLAQMPSDIVQGDLRYMPLAHPGLLPEPGTMVVSYSRNRTNVDEIIKNPLLYRPRFLRVRLRP